ncbi:DUF3558 domain-containing protein [Nocardia nepalensis]|uniref:DUF3558 domain-containing protein n=1 Tax=Nocardia nepalensis TaxID=3375448 RepID=UPI003B6836B6
MGIRRGRQVDMLRAVLLCSVLWLVGCSHEIADLEYRSGFSSLPATCADAVKPVEQAVQAFAGDLYSPAVGFEQSHTSSEYAQDLYCAAKYDDPVPREPIKPYRVPMSRSVTINYDIVTLPILAGATTTGLLAQATTTSNSSPPMSVPGVGEDAITWVEQPKAAVRIGLRFRIGNLQVEVVTSGEDWSGIPESFPVGDSPELRKDLQSGAESVAKAVAQQARSVLPTTVLPWPSSASTTSTAAPTTTKSQIPVWDPCTIPDRDLAAAGLEPGSKRSGAGTVSDYASCMWHGAWYSFSIYSTSVPFAAEVYDRDKYVRPTPLTIGGRPAVQLYWADSDYFCDIAFDVARDPRSGVASGTVTFETSVSENGRRPELCSELKRVTNTLVGAVPPGR